MVFRMASPAVCGCKAFGVFGESCDPNELTIFARMEAVSLVSPNRYLRCVRVTVYTSGLLKKMGLV